MEKGTSSKWMPYKNLKIKMLTMMWDKSSTSQAFFVPSSLLSLAETRRLAIQKLLHFPFRFIQFYSFCVAKHLLRLLLPLPWNENHNWKMFCCVEFAMRTVHHFFALFFAHRDSKFDWMIFQKWEARTVGAMPKLQATVANNFRYHFNSNVLIPCKFSRQPERRNKRMCRSNKRCSNTETQLYY